MKFDRNILITAVLVSIVLSVLLVSPLQFAPFKIKSVKANPGYEDFTTRGK